MLILGPFRSPAVCPEASAHDEHVETTCCIHRNIVWCEANAVWPVWCRFLRNMKFIIFCVVNLEFVRLVEIPLHGRQGSVYHAESISLRRRHNGHYSVSNHQARDCLLNRLFRRRSKKTSKLRVTGLCAGNSPRIGEFPAQMASSAENVSTWWRHHDHCRLTTQKARVSAAMVLSILWNRVLVFHWLGFKLPTSSHWYRLRQYPVTKYPVTRNRRINWTQSNYALAMLLTDHKK